MYGYVNGVDFHNLEAEKFWSFPKTYKGNKKEETKYMITNEQYYCSEKKDGHYSRLIKDEDGNIIMQGRTKSVSGEYLDKHEWLPQLQSFFNKLPNGTVLLGELYFPNNRGSRKVTTILGCLKDKAIERQNKGDKLHYYIFDVWAYNGKSLLNTTMKERIDKYLNYNFIDLFKGEKYVEKANYLIGQDAWNELGKILNSGGEGMVITKLNSKPEPGKRTARKTLKVKMEIEQTIDAFITGEYKPATREYKGKEIENWNFWENIKTGEKYNINKFDEYISGIPVEPITKAYYYGWASSIELAIFKDDEVIHLTWISGISDDIKRDIVYNKEELIDKVVEVTCMEVEWIDGKCGLRHPKIVQFRQDKTKNECNFSQIA